MIGKDREKFKPYNLVVGEELLHNFMNYHEPQINFDEIIDKIYNIEPETLREKNVFQRLLFRRW